MSSVVDQLLGTDFESLLKRILSSHITLAGEAALDDLIALSKRMMAWVCEFDGETRFGSRQTRSPKAGEDPLRNENPHWLFRRKADR